MATNVVAAGGADEPHEDPRDEREERRGERPPERPQPSRAAAGHGFFAIYKKGQGYWTRMGTALGALLLGGLTAYNIYVYLPVLIHFDTTVEGAHRAKQLAIAVSTAFFAAFAFFAWRTMNKPSNVDFLIATDSEMKKVNWTSRKDLIGSTKVVILFTLAVTLLLFVVDLLFGYLFYFLGVLKTRPF